MTNTGGVITVDGTGILDLTGGDTINNGQLNNAGSINVSGSGNEIENETGLATIGSGTNSFTNTGTLTVLGGATAGTLTLLDDLVTNTGGVITVDASGTLDLTGGDTINNGQLNNAGSINVSGSNTIENETGLATIGSGTNSFTNTGTLTVLGGATAGTLTLLDDLVTNTGSNQVDARASLDRWWMAPSMTSASSTTHTQHLRRDSNYFHRKSDPRQNQNSPLLLFQMAVSCGDRSGTTLRRSTPRWTIPMTPINLRSDFQPALYTLGT